MFGLKFTLSDVASFLRENLSGLKKKYIQARIYSYNTTKVIIGVPELPAL